MMIQSIKNSIWDCIKDKDVALFMIFSDEGEILWHQGREVKGRNIMEGKGFCRSYCLEALKKRREIAGEDCLVNLNGHGLSESALILNIKQLMIFPVSHIHFFNSKLSLKKYAKKSVLPHLIIYLNDDSLPHGKNYLKSRRMTPKRSGKRPDKRGVDNGVNNGNEKRFE